jgi:hypothetical protein
MVVVKHTVYIYFKWSAQQISFARGLPQIGIRWACGNKPNSHSPFLPVAGGPKGGIRGIVAIKATS